VYRARDNRLDRQVAVKSLPDAFRADPERAARFEREAKLLASLNHPHIAAIYGLEQADGQQFIVMELVEGETLADRIARGPIPLDEALPIARQIGEALEAAHEQGIIHRDLKPANIKLRVDGTVKVLDFGLAKALTQELSASSSAGTANSPTITSPAVLSGVGVVLGTASYMSPEQAKGRPAEKRSDIWAFGSVLYEMLTGPRAFAGEDVSDTIAAVLRGEPDWTALPATVPPPIRSLVEGCLKKDRLRRIGGMAAALYVLDQRDGPAPAAPLLRPARWKYGVSIGAAAIAATLVTAAVMRRPAEEPRVPARFPIPLPEGQQFTAPRDSLLISLRMALGSRTSRTRSSTFARFSELEPRVIAGSENVGNVGTNLAFSPEGDAIAFTTSDSTLKRIAVTGGTPVTIGIFQGGMPLGISWTSDGILFGDSNEGIMRVRLPAGKPELLVPRGRPPQPFGVGHPRMLPDGSILFSRLTRGRGRWAVRRNWWWWIALFLI
jgi:hypothetical protein